MKQPIIGWRLRLGVVVLCILVQVAAQGAVAGCLDERPLRGVNLAGAEFNANDSLPGRLNKDYVYAKDEAIRTFAEHGATAIRLPVRWERLQHEFYGPLNAADRVAIERLLQVAQQEGVCLLLDVHNYGKYDGERLGSEAVPAAAFLDLWRRLAKLGGPEHLALDLMNEPIAMDVSVWARVAKRTVKGLRDAGNKHLILVSGGRWSGVHDWDQAGSDVSNAQAFATLDDPLDRTLIEVHQYPDDNYSGTRDHCHRPKHFKKMFDEIDAWARHNGRQLLLGEFGAPDNGNCLDALGYIVRRASNASVWRGWTYWAAGPWWGDYPLALQLKDERRPRWDRIEPFLPGPGLAW